MKNHPIKIGASTMTLSKEYRLRVVEIACKIRLDREVSLEDMIWFNKLIEANPHARGIAERFAR